jgi:sortase A
MRDSGLRWLERALLAIGVVCLGWYGYVSLEAASFQRAQAAAFARMAEKPISAETMPAAPHAVRAPDDALIGMLEVPRLRLSTPVMLGDDDRTLEIAAGHLPDTPRPWEPGNSAIAGHRDGLFRPLKDIRAGDDVVMRTSRGDFNYRVRDIRIVRPDDLSVLAQSATSTLTLITCYPFNFIGNAPQRFIVRAERMH